ncbi:MAG: hypothetical protein WC408_03890, partial [Candidatus Micrarchaeia archaeon]
MSRKGQSGLEYLLLFGGSVLIVSVVLTLSSSVASSSESSVSEGSDVFTGSIDSLLSGSPQTPLPVATADPYGLSVDGACGPAAKYYPESATAYDGAFCSAGTALPSNPEFPGGGSSSAWACRGVNRGNSASCTASREVLPVAGKCGSIAGTKLDSAPSNDLCSVTSVTPSVQSTSTGWEWHCIGINGGSPITCSANRQTNGVCGPAAANTYTKPSTGLCNPGEASSIAGNGPWTWTCAGYYGGDKSPTCTAPQSVDGECSSNVNGQKYYTFPSGIGLCSVGSDSDAVLSGLTWSWSCAGSNGGITASCSAYKKVDGVCGSATASTYAEPAANLCNPGTPSLVSGDGPWTWTCNGLNDGIASPTCTALKKVDGVCLPAANGKQLYNLPANSASLCSYSDANPSLVLTGLSWSWSCTGSNGGASPSCSALKKVDGSCSSGVNGKNYYTLPAAASLCSSTGLVPSASLSGLTWSWSCTGQNGGTTAP